MQGLPFQNTYVNLPESFYARAKADEVPNPTLIAFNNDFLVMLPLKGQAPSHLPIQAISSGTLPQYWEMAGLYC